MKKMIHLFLSGSFLLFFTGCSIFVQDTYSTVSTHIVAPVAEGTGLIAIENYRELVNAITYFVSEYDSTGQIRLSGYEKENASTDMEEAVTEILTKTALGSYGVSAITWDVNNIMSNLEAEINITYTKEEENFQSIQKIDGTSAMVRSISQSIASCSPELVLQNSWSSSNRNQISSLLQRAMTDSVTSLVEIPEIHVSFHPKEGPWLILELQFTYETSETTLLRRQELLTEALDEQVGALWSMGSMDVFQLILGRLSELAKYSTQGNTPYDILLLKKGNSQGFALTLLAFCQEMGLDALLVEGTLNGTPHYWNQITLETGEVHYVDVTIPPDEMGIYPYFGEDSLAALGYLWDQSLFPTATEIAPDEEKAPF